MFLSNFASQIDVIDRTANSSNTMIKLFIPRRIQDKLSELISILVKIILELKTQLNKIFGEPLIPVIPGKMILKYLYEMLSLVKEKHSDMF